MEHSPENARRLLFDWLCGSVQAPADTLSQAEWDWIAQVARDYRLRPLLHLRTSIVDGPPFPQNFAEECARAFAKNRMRWLSMQASIVRTSRALFDAGVPHVFLKGAALALGEASEHAVRPMRDLDILVAPDHALAARDGLLGIGFASLPGNLESALDDGYQQPAVMDPANRVVVELHHDLAAVPSHPTRPLADFVLASAEHVPLGGQPIPISTPCATFLHLLLHAGPKSLFDCGPLLLADIAGLIDRRADRLGELPERVAQFGLLPTFSLVLRLLVEHGVDTRKLGIEHSDLPAVPEALVDHAEALLVQPVEGVHQRKMVRQARGQARRSLALGKAASRALMPSRTGIVAISGGRIGDHFLWLRYPHWLLLRSRQFLGGLRDRALGEEVAKDSALTAYLLGTPSPSTSRNGAEDRIGVS